MIRTFLTALFIFTTSCALRADEADKKDRIVTPMEVLTQKLELTEAQKKEFEKVYREMQLEVLKVQKKHRERMLYILNEEQRKKFNAMKGRWNAGKTDK